MASIETLVVPTNNYDNDRRIRLNTQHRVVIDATIQPFQTMAVNILYRINSSAQKPQITSINPGPLTSEQFDGNLRSIKDAIDVIETAYLPLAGGILTGRLTLNGDASNELEPVTYRQLQSTVSGLMKSSVRVATTGAITLTGLQTIDGVGIAEGDRVLVKDQLIGDVNTNGIYTASPGDWSRTTDMDSWSNFPDAFVFVKQGTINAGTGWVCTADVGGTLETTDITWTMFSGAGSLTAGAGIDISGTQISVSPATISTLGAVKVGNGLSIDGDGVLSVGSSVSFTDQYFTPTADNTFTFQPVGGYETGKIELYINGLLQYPGYDYTASDDTNIVMVDDKPISTTDKLLIRKWKSPTNTLFVEQTFEPQSPTAQFAVTGDYTPGAVTVYLNGILLLGSGDGFVANTGRTVDTTIPITSGDNLLVRKWITDFVHPFNEIVVIPSDANVNSVTVPGGYIPGTIEVYLNGVLLYGDGDNYRAADGRTIIDMSTAVGPLDRLLVRRWSMWAI